MAEAVLTTDKVFGNGKGKPKADANDTHIIIEDETTLRKDLAYLASKLGVDIEQLKAERRLKEKQAKEAVRNKKIEKHKRAWAAREAALEAEFLKNYGDHTTGHYLIVLNGHRVQVLKDFTELVCPECGAAIPAIRGFCQHVVELNKNGNIYGDGLSSVVGIPSRIDEPKCQNGHVNKTIIQYIW